MILRLIAVCMLAPLALVAGPLAAQGGNNLVQVVTVQVRPGTEPLLEEFVHALRDAAEKQEYGTAWLASQSVSGAPAYTFAIQHGTWAKLGDPGPNLVDAVGEDEARRLGELAARSIESEHSAFYMAQPDLSVPPPPMDEGPQAVIYYDLTLNEGMAPQYIEGSRKTREASLAVTPDSYYLVQMPNVGASAVRVVGIVQSWDDLDGGIMNPGQRVIEHFGEEEGAEIVEMVTATISDIQISLNRTRPDLGYQPED